jgi:Asp/Glu/hydantoin racemase
VKVLWQSFLDPEDHRPYVDALRSLLAQTAPEAEFEVVGIRPPDRHLCALTEVRCGIAALRNALWAEREGYDAIVIGHFQEPFLHEIRSSVGMPVVGFGEASFDAADGAIGLVTIDDVFVPWHEEQVRRYGIADRVVGVRSLGIAPDDFMAAMTDGAARERLRARVEESVAPLVAAGAETIVSAGALACVALREPAIAGVPYVDGVAAAARAAVTRRRPETFDPPPRAALDEFLAATGGPLIEPVRQ